MASPPGRRARALPRVAIIGRPNVGKSTLFNALLGRRRTITHSTAGVTRDPVEVEAVLGGVRALLVDTGGYATDADGLDDVVSARSLKAAREADVVVFVLDALETTPLDREFMRLLRPAAPRLVVVVNKVDTPDRDTLVWNAHAHGFPVVAGVSAEHRRGTDGLRAQIGALLDAAALARAAGPAEERGEARAGDAEARDAPHPRAGTHGATGREAAGPPAAEDGAPVRIAILGKPNSGKSSLANRLLGEERSIVSDVPGTTRDVVEAAFVHRGRAFRILDTAGIRRRNRVTQPVEYYSVTRAFDAIGRADVVLLVVDATTGLVDQDKKIAAQAVKEGRGIVIVLSKWDLVGGSSAAREETTEKVRFQFPVLGFAPVVPVSAHSGYGIRRLLETAAASWDQLHRRVGTGRLNTALAKWMEHKGLPVRGKNYRIRFMTQVGTNPLRFVAFVNRMAGFPTAYSQYLENCIRREFGVKDVPVSVEFRQTARSPRGAPR